jgi:hypothetical protein
MEIGLIYGTGEGLCGATGEEWVQEYWEAHNGRSILCPEGEE